ncbi:metalloregulator ArsR/SmtB family transcription factor [Rathayibacter sp. VKM Ac-2759]|uniref:metalloregulator ArsR/SmtB family transcription factor n=1 Tax=Rathayibacter sp. VKM Ac-2759 TaxID=2609252 RepID=UPI001319B4AF|nr:metalloregulator ArsR/SmtB family transcription factor [Rathayibacter sp. VKM Ac-2759]QHC67759.1 metalloregulator ArsR/SmtB family transcription factor [Rathayibacter sp. VKM Ac-2759]
MDVGGSTSALRLLADPTRARIASMILGSADGRQLVGKMADALELRQPTVSHHVRVLVDEGILAREPQGRNVWYSIVPEQLDRVSEYLRDAPVPARVEADVLDRIIADLAVRFAGTFSRETVERYVRESHELLIDRGHVTRHLTSLTSRFATDRLTALDASAAGRSGVPDVLFVCVQNAGRSQLAAAILRHLAGDRVRVRTAGSEPADAVRSVIVTALDEIGVPIGGEYPKPLTDEVVRASDVVITMGCGDACPIYPGRRYLDWDLADPVGLPLAQVRVIRDDIDGRVRALLASLEATAA